MAGTPDLSARALAHVTESKSAARERIQRENADKLVWRQTYIDRFDAAPIFMECLTTGRQWGKDICQRVREAGGKGIAVQASASCKPGKQLKERK